MTWRAIMTRSTVSPGKSVKTSKRWQTGLLPDCHCCAHAPPAVHRVSVAGSLDEEELLPGQLPAVGGEGGGDAANDGDAAPAAPGRAPAPAY